MVIENSGRLEELICVAMQRIGIDRLIAYQLAKARLEYEKENHGKWEGNT